MAEELPNAKADDSAAIAANERSSRLRAILEAALVNPNDTVALDAAIMEAGADMADPGVAMVRSLAESVKTGAITAQQAKQVLENSTAASSPTLAGATATPEGAVTGAIGQNAAAAAVSTPETGAQAVAATPTGLAASAVSPDGNAASAAAVQAAPDDKTAEVFNRLGLKQNETGMSIAGSKNSAA